MINYQTIKNSDQFYNKKEVVNKYIKLKELFIAHYMMEDIIN